MTFEILKATIEDARELARLYHECFADNTDYHASFRAVSASELEAEIIFDFAQSFGCKWTHIYKVVDMVDQRIVGFTKWQFPHTAVEEHSRQQLYEQNRQHSSIMSSEEMEGVNLGLIYESYWQSNWKKDRYLNVETDCDIIILAVHPSFRRLGLGSRLLQAGIDAVDMLGAKVYVAATLRGLNLYRRHGFEQVDEFGSGTIP